MSQRILTLTCENPACGKTFQYQAREVLGSLAAAAPAVPEITKEVFYLTCPYCKQSNRYEA